MKNNLKGFAFLIPAIILIIVFILIPFIYAIVNSFTITDNIIFTNSFGVNNFTQVAQEQMFIISFRNSNFLFFITMPIAMFFSLLFAFLLNSIKVRWFKKLITITYFSQFFISVYAIGLSFIYLFDSDINVFNQWFGTNIRFTDDNSGMTSLLTLSIFMFWRLFTFNFVFIYFALVKVTSQKIAMSRLDNFNWWNKFKYVYYPEIKRTLLMLLYLNLLETIFLFPGAIYSDEAQIRLYDSSTLAYYIYYQITNQDYGKAGAGAVYSLLYLTGLFIAFYSLKKGLYFYLKERSQKWK